MAVARRLVGLRLRRGDRLAGLASPLPVGRPNRRALLARVAALEGRAAARAEPAALVPTQLRGFDARRGKTRAAPPRWRGLRLLRLSQRREGRRAQGLLPAVCSRRQRDAPRRRERARGLRLGPERDGHAASRQAEARERHHVVHRPIGSLEARLARGGSGRPRRAAHA